MMTDAVWRPPPGTSADPQPPGNGLAEAVGWLGDPEAPRLLLLSSPGSDAADSLAAVLVAMAQDMEPTAGIHAQASARGLGPRTLSWVLAAQLGLMVSGPAELVDRLAEDRRTTTVLVAEHDDPTDSAALVVELIAPLLRLPHVRLILACSSPPAGLGVSGLVLGLAGSGIGGPTPEAESTEQQPRLPPRLAATVFAEPGTLLGAEPLELSASIEAAWVDLPPVRRRQWDWFGQALTTVEPASPARASLLHLVALATADDALAQAVRPYLAGAPASVLWSRWEPVDLPAIAALGESSSGTDWPGPVTALCVSRGPGAGTLLALDTLGRVHGLDPDTGRERGRPDRPPLRGRGLAALESGGLLLADSRGALDLSQAPEESGDTDRIGDLLSPDRSPSAHDRSVLLALHDLAPGPVAALAGDHRSGVLVLGSEDGVVRLFDARTREIIGEPTYMHQGPVTAVSAGTVDDVDSALCFASGGADGRLRAGVSGESALGSTLAARGVPVTAVATASTPSGLVVAAGWADGLITRYKRVCVPEDEAASTPSAPLWREAAEPLSLGSPPTAMCLTASGVLVAACSFGLVALQTNVF